MEVMNCYRLLPLPVIFNASLPLRFVMLRSTRYHYGNQIDIQTNKLAKGRLKMIKYLHDKQVLFEKRLEVFEELRNSLSRNHFVRITRCTSGRRRRRHRCCCRRCCCCCCCCCCCRRWLVGCSRAEALISWHLSKKNVGKGQT